MRRDTGRIGGETDGVGEIVERAVQIAAPLAREAALEPRAAVVRIAGNRPVERCKDTVDIVAG